MHIRKANATDATAIAKVHVDSWRTTYSGIVPDDYLVCLSYEQRELLWRDQLCNTDSQEFTYVVEDSSGVVVGFAGGGPERTGHAEYKGELYGIYILETHQRKGVGRQLTSAVIKRLLQVGIHSYL